MGNYVALVTYTDANGDIATYNMRIGKNASEWDAQPLSSFDDISVLADRENYTTAGMVLGIVWSGGVWCSVFSGVGWYSCVGWLGACSGCVCVSVFVWLVV